MPAPTTIRILAVDDSLSARRVLQGIFFQLGVTAQDLRLASSAAEALAMAAEWGPDVVFLDMELRPNGTESRPPSHGKKGEPPVPTTGDELGRELLRRNPGLPVVVVTALDRSHPRVARLVADGAVDVIVKPVRAARVQEVLDRIASPKARVP
jgi:CheY-like chemotaxis protein